MRPTRPATQITFNLSILECKYNQLSFAAQITASFNLSILECKFYWYIRGKPLVQLLISPYWNVNDKFMSSQEIIAAIF